MGSILNHSDLKCIDYAAQFGRGDDPDLKFPSRGYVFGPLRLTSSGDREAGFIGEKEASLIRKITSNDYIKDKKCVVMLRDPRDILVSSYYSFGYSHVLSEDLSIRSGQISERSSIQAMSVDEYVLKRVDGWAIAFDKAHQVLSSAQESMLIKYEDMIFNFDQFSSNLRKYIPIQSGVIDQLYMQTRPRESEDLLSHKRSGRPGGYAEKLASDTISRINDKLSDCLTMFGYEKS